MVTVLMMVRNSYPHEKIFNINKILISMREFKVFRSIRFQEEISKYNKDIQDRVDKIEDKLVFNSEYGNPLGVRWFRESRFENYRIYYLVYDDLGAIYLVAISNKKNQQALRQK